MNETLKKSDRRRQTPLQSPHAALQSLLPRLRTLGPRSKKQPFFDTRREALQYLTETGKDEEFCVVAVWAIDHSDLTNSEVSSWSYARWIN